MPRKNWGDEFVHVEGGYRCPVCCVKAWGRHCEKWCCPACVDRLHGITRLMRGGHGCWLVRVNYRKRVPEHCRGFSDSVWGGPMESLWKAVRFRDEHWKNTSQRKLTPEAVKAIQRAKGTVTQEVLAKRYGVSRVTIQNVQGGNAHQGV